MIETIVRFFQGFTMWHWVILVCVLALVVEAILPQRRRSR